MRISDWSSDVCSSDLDGGKSLIAVTDDGCGMTADDLLLAVERHATSKLPQDDLQAIATLGFRGEALPSIGAVSRLAITARARDADSARSEERRVGNECVSTCRSRWSPDN